MYCSSKYGVVSVMYLETLYQQHAQNYWDFGLRPSSRILNTRKQRFGNCVCFRLQVKVEKPTLLGPLENWKTPCQSQSHIATDGRSVCQSILVSSPHLGLMTRYLLLFDSYSLVIVGRPL
jgi:hypothetical protein